MQDDTEIALFGKALTKIERNSLLRSIKQFAKQLEVPSPVGFGFYYNEIQPAVYFVSCLLRGQGVTGLIFQPMQVGKTNTIACIFLLLRHLSKSVQGIFICGNDQIDLRGQNMDSLEHLDIKVMTRSDRANSLRDSLKEFKHGTPVVVFYDESHFADGVDMSIDRYIEFQEVRSLSNVIFCGVSATPWSSIGKLDFQYLPDLDDLESRGYCSVRTLIEQNRIVDSEPLFEKDEHGEVYVVEDNPICLQIAREVDRTPNPHGFGIVRCKHEEAIALEEYLKREHGSRIYVRHWNMRQKDFNPESFFQAAPKRVGVFTVLILQHKARMGTRIPTEHCRFMYEYAPSSTLDTAMQSFIGRACGFGKQVHKCVVYSSLIKAEAYRMLLEAGDDFDRQTEFRDFCKENRIRLSSRAEFAEDGRESLYLAKLLWRKVYHGRTSNDTIRREMRDIIRSAIASGRINAGGAIRTLSERNIPPRLKGRSLWNPNTVDNNAFVPEAIGSWAGMIFDDYKAGVYESTGLKKNWNGKVALIAYRTDDFREPDHSHIVRPKKTSLFHRF